MESGIVILFGLTSFLASALLFSVEPMIGKMVLPVFGGTPAVWNTCLRFLSGNTAVRLSPVTWDAADRIDRAAIAFLAYTCWPLPVFWRRAT